MNRSWKAQLVLILMVLSIVATQSVFGAEIKELRMIDNNHAPLKLVVIHTSSTNSFVKDLFNIVKLINEQENLPAAERLKLHIVPSSGNPIAQLGISAADAEKYVEVNAQFSSSDIWAQDCMELCSAKTTDGNDFVPAVFDTGRGRGLGGLPKALATLWNLAYAKNPSTAAAHGDYGGNLEIAPFDDVMVVGNTVTAPCKAFFAKMGYSQRFFSPDTSWLTVGHIDEYVSFIPTSHAPGGYSIVRADTEYALKLITDAPDSDFSKLDSDEAALLREVKKTLLGQKRDPNFGRGTQAGDFIELNRNINQIVDKNVDDFKQFIRKVTGNPDRDFGEVAWPSLYEGRGGSKPSGCCAYLPGVVNLLVLRNHLVVPASNIPSFDRAIEARFRAQGNRVHFVDDEPYHNSMGEIHCGTNVLRSPEKTVVKKEQIEKVQNLKKLFNSMHEIR